MMDAIEAKDYEEVKRLLVEGANPNARDVCGYTPLCVAARVGDASIASLLITFGAFANDWDHRGMSPLHHACHGGFFKVVKTLTESGAANLGNGRMRAKPSAFAASSEIEAYFESL